MRAAEGVEIAKLNGGHVSAAQEYAGVRQRGGSEPLAQSSRRGRAFGIRWWLKALAQAGAPDLSELVRGCRPAQPRNVVPSPEEVARLMNCPDLATRWLVLCGAHCALRFGTAYSATVGNCEGGVLRRRTKAGQVAEVPLSQPMVALVAAAALQGNSNQRVCDALAGRPLKRVTYQRRWRLWKLKAGVREEVQPHDLRRALARQMYEETGDIRQVQRLLGHASTWATFHYIGSAATEPLNLAALRAARKETTGDTT